MHLALENQYLKLPLGESWTSTRKVYLILWLCWEKHVPQQGLSFATNMYTMRQLLAFIVFALCSVGFFSCAPKSTETPLSETPEPAPKPAPNIILIIGDGTGLTQLSTLWYSGDEKPNYERFDVVGLSKTNSSSHQITDSGAGATAFSIGEKTYNGAIGVDKDSVSKTNITEILSEKGYATGVVATSSITHATPASFYAHVKSRNDHFTIASQLVTSDIDFFAGGGIKYFTKQPDSSSLLPLLKENGFVVDTHSIDTNLTGAKVGYLLAKDGLPTMTDGRGDFLLKATEKALNYMDAQEAPFFLMIEGSQVDWGGHANDAEYIRTEVRDLDKTVGIALDYAAKHENTLVVALADHETGGFALSPVQVNGFGGVKKDDYNKVEGRFTTGGHTCTHIPVFASGPNASAFSGVYENNTVFDKLLETCSL